MSSKSPEYPLLATPHLPINSSLRFGMSTPSTLHIPAPSSRSLPARFRSHLPTRDPNTDIAKNLKQIITCDVTGATDVCSALRVHEAQKNHHCSPAASSSLSSGERSTVASHQPSCLTNLRRCGFTHVRRVSVSCRVSSGSRNIVRNDSPSKSLVLQVFGSFKSAG